jgi:hypothetical protein
MLKDDRNHNSRDGWFESGLIELEVGKVIVKGVWKDVGSRQIHGKTRALIGL